LEVCQDTQPKGIRSQVYQNRIWIGVGKEMTQRLDIPVCPKCQSIWQKHYEANCEPCGITNLLPQSEWDGSPTIPCSGCQANISVMFYPYTVDCPACQIGMQNRADLQYLTHRVGNGKSFAILIEGTLEGYQAPCYLFGSAQEILKKTALSFPFENGTAFSIKDIEEWVKSDIYEILKTFQ
jgi:Zn-finger nucleic acid-binding protein